MRSPSRTTRPTTPLARWAAVAPWPAACLVLAAAAACGGAERERLELARADSLATLRLERLRDSIRRQSEVELRAMSDSLWTAMSEIQQRLSPLRLRRPGTLETSRDTRATRLGVVVERNRRIIDEVSRLVEVAEARRERLVEASRTNSALAEVNESLLKQARFAEGQLRLLTTELEAARTENAALSRRLGEATRANVVLQQATVRDRAAIDSLQQEISTAYVIAGTRAELARIGVISLEPRRFLGVVPRSPGLFVKNVSEVEARRLPSTPVARSATVIPLPATGSWRILTGQSAAYVNDAVDGTARGDRLVLADAAAFWGSTRVLVLLRADK